MEKLFVNQSGVDAEKPSISNNEESGYYATSFEHVLAELDRVDILLRDCVYKARSQSTADDEFQGLYISERQVDELLEKSNGLPGWADVQPDSEEVNVRSLIARMSENINQKKENGESRGVQYKLEILKKIFSLSRFEIDVMLVCLARELDLRYEKLFSYLQDDISKKNPSIDLVLNLFSTSLLEKIEMRKYFSAQKPIFEYGLLELFDADAHQNSAYLNKCLRMDPRIVDYLFDHETIDCRISPYINYTFPEGSLDEILLPVEVKNRLLALSGTDGGSSGTIFYFQGPDGVGKRSTVEALCANRGFGLIAADLTNIISNPNFATIIRMIVREAMIQSVPLYLRNIDELLEEKNRTLFQELMRSLEGFSNHVYVSGTSAWQVPDEILYQRFFKIEFKRQNYRDRIRLWERMLRCLPCRQDLDVDEISGRFRLTGGKIKRAADTAYNLAYWRDPDAICITREDVYMACREQSNQKLSKLAQKITPHYGWHDIVLPAKKMKHLREIYSASKNRNIVYETWGFNQKLSLGKGLNVLFSGPSGTGKTMAAEIIAGELGLELYKIDLSNVVSKYIGETEKNLSSIFLEAESANAILFFDEADALFGKRSEVRDAHDRYANIETGYLLQKMEEYTGVVFLATNLDKNMDEAFSRRMHFAVEFPFPGIKERLSIWQKVWPEKTPIDNLDLDFMAQRFELTGGNIKNIALCAAFLAASDDESVKMPHLVQALQREHQKNGKILMGEEYGCYSKFVV